MKNLLILVVALSFSKISFCQVELIQNGHFEFSKNEDCPIFTSHIPFGNDYLNNIQKHIPYWYMTGTVDHLKSANGCSLNLHKFLSDQQALGGSKMAGFYIRGGGALGGTEVESLTQPLGKYLDDFKKIYHLSYNLKNYGHNSSQYTGEPDLYNDLHSFTGTITDFPTTVDIDILNQNVRFEGFYKDEVQQLMAARLKSIDPKNFITTIGSNEGLKKEHGWRKFEGNFYPPSRIVGEGGKNRQSVLILAHFDNENYFLKHYGDWWNGRKYETAYNPPPFPNTYFFLDNVSLIEKDFCDFPSALDIKSPTIDFLTNIAVPNNNQTLDQFLQAGVSNGYWYDIVIWNRYGTIVYEKKSTIDQLHEGRKGRLMLWDGTTSSGAELPQGTYYCTLNVYNCAGQATKTSSPIALVGGGKKHDFPEPLNLFTQVLPRLCSNPTTLNVDKSCGSGIFPSKLEAVYSRINGTEITLPCPGEMAIMKENTTHKGIIFKAENSVSLEIGFEAEYGSNFTAMLNKDYSLNQCEFEEVVKFRKSKAIESKPENIDLSFSDETNEVSLILHPNPTNSIAIYELKNSKEKIERIIIYDTFGNAILSELTEPIGYIDTANFAKGTFIAKVTSASGKVFTSKLIVY